MKSNDERIKTLENFNIIGRKKRPVAAVLLLLLTAVFIVLGIIVPSFCNSCCDSADNLGDFLLSRRRRVSFLCP
jgi:hypothetical protein